MKSMIVLAISLIASAAFAYPKVGDTVSFNGTVAGSGGGSVPFTQKLTLTAFDAATAMYTMNVEINFRGQLQTSNDQVKASDLLTGEQVASVLANCAAYGGSLEDVVVPMGTLKSCHLPQDNNGHLWIADIAFGIAKQISFDQDGTQFTIEAASAVAAQ